MESSSVWSAFSAENLEASIMNFIFFLFWSNIKQLPQPFSGFIKLMVYYTFAQMQNQGLKIYEEMQKINWWWFWILTAGYPGRCCNVAYQTRSVYLHLGSFWSYHEIRREANSGREGLCGRHSCWADESRTWAEDGIQTQDELYGTFSVLYFNCCSCILHL